MKFLRFLKNKNAEVTIDSSGASTAAFLKQFLVQKGDRN
jgi:hypothetical protein